MHSRGMKNGIPAIPTCAGDDGRIAKTEMAGHGAPPQEPVSACLFNEDLERDQRVDRQRHEVRQRRNTDDTCILTSRAGQPGTSVRKERTEGDILRNAAFASLDGRALTPKAKKLVAEINTRVV